MNKKNKNTEVTRKAKDEHVVFCFGDGWEFNSVVQNGIAYKYLVCRNTPLNPLGNGDSLRECFEDYAKNCEDYAERLRESLWNAIDMLKGDTIEEIEEEIENK